MTESKVIQDGTEVIIKIDTITLDDLLPIIEQALRGAGYSFNGNLDIVEE